MKGRTGGGAREDLEGLHIGCFLTQRMFRGGKGKGGERPGTKKGNRGNAKKGRFNIVIRVN